MVSEHDHRETSLESHSTSPKHLNYGPLLVNQFSPDCFSADFCVSVVGQKYHDEATKKEHHQDAEHNSATSGKVNFGLKDLKIIGT